MTSAELWLARHAESVESGVNPSQPLTADPDLSRLGLAQAGALRRRLSSLPAPSTWHSSPRLRAVRTAEIAGATALTVLDELAEFDRGLMSSVDPADTAYAQVWRSGDWTAWPGGETRPAFRDRCARYVDEWALHAVDEEVTIAFTHSGVIRECVAHVLGSAEAHRLRMLPTSITRLGRLRSGAVVLAVNDVWHLEDQLGRQFRG